MDDDYIQVFDLTMLLKSGELDIRGVAAKNETLLEEEYYALLFKFLRSEQVLITALRKIAAHMADEEVLNYLMDTKVMLGSIGSTKLCADMESILEVLKSGNEELVARCVQTVLEGFANLYCCVEDALIKDNRDEVLETDNPEDNSHMKLSLKTVLENLYYNEDNRKLRILSVDDAPFMLHTISSILSNDYEVFSLVKGTLVEKFLQHTTPDLFLLDYTMPEINGFELVSIIRRIKEHKDTPIIFLTAIGTAHHVKTAFSLGVCDYVVKPINAEILREKIAKHIIRKRVF